MKKDFLILKIKEKWKVYKSNSNYAVSDFGRVKRLTKGMSTFPGRILKPGRDRTGYLEVRLYKRNGEWKTYKVHRLVLEIFIGPCPEGCQCNHKDGVKSNNYVGNLEWVTSGENNRHAIKLGLINCKGENNPRSKLTENQIREIRKLHKTGNYIQEQLAKKFNVSQPLIGCIVNRKIWKHI